MDITSAVAAGGEHTDHQSVADLLSLAATGDEPAWSRLVAIHHNLLRSIARGYRLTDEEAGDATQNAWVALLTRLGTLRDPRCLAGWLASTMRHECLKIIRRRARERPADTTLLIEVGPPAEDVGLDHSLLVAERDAILWRAVDQLPTRQQQVLRALAATPPPSYEEVAAQMQVSIGTIGPTRMRALQRLRALLVAALETGALELTA
jgi:RNA polymerase sigma factor (sigma-70 family)